MPKPVIYADACCLNRPLDDQQQPRIKLESEAMLTILQNCEEQKWSLLSSDALQFEIARNTDASKQEKLEAMLSLAETYIASTPEIETQAQALKSVGFTLYDALHLASAQSAAADVFLTTDDRLLKKAKRYNQLITIPVENPVTWLMNVLLEKDESK